MGLTSRMFPFITKTWNPIGGSCPYNCVYCWAKTLIKRHKFKKYVGAPRIIDKELRKKFTAEDFVFVQDMSDLFAGSVSTRLILEVLDYIRDSPAKFLLMTKNPNRYYQFAKDSEFFDNMVLGCTIETNAGIFYHSTPSEYETYMQLTNAPPVAQRIDAMANIHHETSLPTFISVEPILNFHSTFAQVIKFCKPWAVAVGYDNYNHKLPEPRLTKTLKLIEDLEKFTTVSRKTLRKAWWET